MVNLKKELANVLNIMLLVRLNNNVLITKELRKEIMKRSKLIKTSLIEREIMKKGAVFKFQRNYCVNLLRKTKKQSHENLSVKNVMDN